MLRLPSFLSRKPGTPPALKTSEEARLRDRFREASYGTHFRTLAYIPPAQGPDRNEWLEAWKAHDTVSWRIRRATQTALPDPAKEVITYETLKDGQPLTFFEAVEALARYEYTQPDMGYAPYGTANREALGTDHYIAFARREGIVFDALTGAPHPTDADGRVAGDGTFVAEDLAAAAAAAQAHAASMETLNTALKKFVPGVMFGRQEIRLDSAADIALADVLGHFHNLRALVRAACNRGWLEVYKPDEKAKKISYSDHLHSEIESAESRFETALEKAFPADSFLKEEMIRSFYRIAYQAALCNTRLSVELCGRKTDLHYKGWTITFTKEDVLIHKKWTAGYMKRAGQEIEPSSALMDRLVAERKSGDYPAIIDDVVAWADGVVDAIWKNNPQPPAPVFPAVKTVSLLPG